MCLAEKNKANPLATRKKILIIIVSPWPSYSIVDGRVRIIGTFNILCEYVPPAPYKRVSVATKFESNWFKLAWPSVSSNVAQLLRPGRCHGANEPLAHQPLVLSEEHSGHSF